MRRLLLVAVVLLAACGGSTEEGQVAACGELAAADPSIALPPGFPAPAGQVLYEEASQGSTRIVFGRVAGTDFVAERDRLADGLELLGFELEGTDQEAVEAEVHFRQPYEGTVKVTRLCEGQLQLRYRLSPP